MQNNKLVSIAAIIVLIILLAPQQVIATSGACSGHGGVNCNAGAGIYGQAICYDGWDGSSVQYSEMVECKGVFVCPKPFTQAQSDAAKQAFVTADAEQNKLLNDLDQISSGTFLLNPSQQSQIDDANADYNALVQQTIDTYNSNHIPIDQGFLDNLFVQHNGLIGQLKSGFYAFDFNTTKTLLDTLRPDWNRKMQLAGCPVVNVQPSLISSPTQGGGAAALAAQFGLPKATPTSTKPAIQYSCSDQNSHLMGDQCYCNNGYAIDKENSCIPMAKLCAEIDSNTHPVGLKCLCDKGFGLGKNGLCIQMGKWCAEKAPNSHAVEDGCLCNAGYVNSTPAGRCIKIASPASDAQLASNTPQDNSPAPSGKALDDLTAPYHANTTPNVLKESVLKRMWRRFLSWF